VGKCAACGTVVAPDGSTVVEDMEYPERSSRWASLAGWIVALTLHSALFLSFAGLNWLWRPGEGEGEGEAEVGIVFDEGGTSIESTDPSPLQLHAPSKALEIQVDAGKFEPIPDAAVRPRGLDTVAPIAVNAGRGSSTPTWSIPAAGGQVVGEEGSSPFEGLAGARSGASFQGIYRNRGGQRKQRAIARYGGHGTLSCVDKGLAWLARNQRQDGSWGKPATSGLALLAFLGAGHTTTRSGKYRAVVQRGFERLISQGRRRGKLLIFPESMYHQGIAAFALAEECALSRNPVTRDAARAAVQTILAAQYRDGGWRYQLEGVRGDTSVVGWQIMALKAAKNAEVHNPVAAFKGAKRFLDSVKSESAKIAGFGYQDRRATWTLSAVGLVCLQFMESENLGLMRKVTRRVLRETPKPDRRPPEIYGLYYAAIGVFQMGGEYWQAWNAPMKKALMSSQRPDGHWEGYRWANRSSFPNAYSTALSVLTLEVYYRYTPIYATE